MCKYVFCFFILLGQAGISMAQSIQDTLFVVPGKESLYFYHVVDKGESLYGVARNYHLDPKTLAKANNMSLNTPLKIYQLLKIPLDSNNLLQSAGVNVSGLTPLYHKVIKGETLYHIGQMHDKVDAGLLKKWNHISGNEVKTGQYLVVGWLKAANATTNQAVASSASSESADQPPVQDNVAAATSSPVTTGEQVVEKTEKKEDVGSASPQAAGGTANTTPGGNFLSEVIASENRSRTTSNSPNVAAASSTKASTEPAAPVSTNSGDDDNDNVFAINDKPAPVKKAEETAPPKAEEVQNKTVVVEKPAPKKEEKKDTAAKPKKDNPFAKMLNEVTHKPQVANPVAEPSNTPATPIKTEAAVADQPVAAGNEATVTTAPATEITPSANPVDSAALTTSAKSEFEQQFIQQTDDGAQVDAKKGAAGWFRSNVKPGSGRYYALCNDLPRGTIVKVINPISGKYVLAKVLDAIPKQKENYNLIVKLSDAAMEDLGVSQSRFWCEIQYAKGKAK